MTGITVSDGLLIAATILGPVAAVQAQKWLERSQNRKERKRMLFQTLMATRAVRGGSNDHVQALNLIELLFDGTNRKDKEVRDAWANYLDFLNEKIPQSEGEARTHFEKGTGLLISLLKAMGKSLGYDFNDVSLKRGVYFPQGHVDESTDQLAIRQGLAKLMKGEKPLDIKVIGS
ncbi:MAG: hypothetical protein KGQ79_01335 [Proteobacteria bacterium]|nr:hypothetical protein [Pseudomonadota bacterium]